MMTSQHLLNFCTSTYKYRGKRQYFPVFQLGKYSFLSRVLRTDWYLPACHNKSSVTSISTSISHRQTNRYLPLQASSLPPLCWSCTTAHCHFVPDFLIHSPLTMVPKSWEYVSQPDEGAQLTLLHRTYPDPSPGGLPAHRGLGTSHPLVLRPSQMT